jgi:hypothetical protein
MQLDDYAATVREQLTAASALGDERTQQIAHALAGTVDSAVRLAVLDAVSAATAEVTDALAVVGGTPTPMVSAHLDGSVLRIAVTSTAAERAEPVSPADEGDPTARISLRLSEALKAEVERAAARADISVNTWLVRAAAAAVRTGDRSPAGWPLVPADRAAHRISGWVTG